MAKVHFGARIETVTDDIAIEFLATAAKVFRDRASAASTITRSDGSETVFLLSPGVPFSIDVGRALTPAEWAAVDGDSGSE